MVLYRGKVNRNANVEVRHGGCDLTNFIKNNVMFVSVKVRKKIRGRRVNKAKHENRRKEEEGELGR